jgi:hypothetical protein
MRNFILVNALRWKPGTVEVAEANGIRKLKRGVTLDTFIANYLTEECELTDDMYVKYNRGQDEEYVCVAQRTLDGVKAYWIFTLYPESELISAVSHLTKEELLRDLKELLPLKVEIT